MQNLIKFCKKNTSYIVFGVLVLIAAVMVVIVVSGKSDGKGKNPSTGGIISNTTNSTTETTTEPQPDSDDVGAEVEEESTAEGETETTVPDEPSEPVDYKYSIRVNTQTNCVTIYTKDENGEFTVPYKAMACSTGLGKNATPLRTSKILKYYKWCRMVDWTYSQYSYRIHGSIMFHSTPCALNLTLNSAGNPSPYYSKGRMEVVEFNKLGTNASLGCIRLTVADAKWICDNCPTGTTTKVVSEPTDPLPKPEVIKIPENIPAECGGYVTTLMPENHRVKPIKWVMKTIYVAWDPTDPDPSNPWHKYTATITCNSTISVEEGSSLETLKSHITAKDTCGNVINHKLKISGTYDLNKIGKYTIKLDVTDALGRSATKTITLMVTEKATTTAPSETVTDDNSSTENTTDDMTSSPEDTTTSDSEDSTTASPEQNTSDATTETSSSESNSETTASENGTTISPETA